MSHYCRKVFVLCGLNGHTDGCFIFGSSKIFKQRGTVCQKAEAREYMQMEGSIRTADEEEKIRPLSVQRSEEDRPFRLCKGDEWLLKKERIVVFGMQKSRAPAYCSGSGLFAGREFREKRCGIVDKPRRIRKIGHVADHAATISGGEAHGHTARREKFRDMAIRASSAAAF